jgi:hypothetical protein
MKATTAAPKIDGRGNEWVMDAQLRSFGLMNIATRYLSRPDLLAGSTRREEDPATVRWSYDNDNLYALIRCPQPTVSDERNTDWPDHAGDTGGVGGADSPRWWGTDGLQLQIASLLPNQAGPAKGESKVFNVAFKPGGVVMVRQATLKAATLSRWSNGPAGVTYGIQIEKEDGQIKAYVIETAIPRKWFANAENVNGLPGPAFRVNLLRHRAHDLASTSWSGPIVNDDDVAMMGLLLGNE